ncbi:MAG: hypothetical protein JSS75_07890 [Bacteroidetes bacterium]|nr:hypothetical protein [Bacteroidota bacterium]
MTRTAPIEASESVSVIEVTGAIALARLLQSIGVETRARIVGATEANAAGVVTVVIAGGLAEVQHASEHVRSVGGVNDVAFFAKPDLAAMELLLGSLKLATRSAPATEEEHPKRRVRSAEELDITEVHDWNVHELRRFARSIENFPLKGRMISKANRAELLDLLEQTGAIFKQSSPMLYSEWQQLPN